MRHALAKKTLGPFWPWGSLAVEDYAPNGKDCVMLVKELVSSDCLSQQPLVILPHDYLPRLCQPLAGMPRTVLADRARKELPANGLVYLSFTLSTGKGKSHLKAY